MHNAGIIHNYFIVLITVFKRKIFTHETQLFRVYENFHVIIAEPLATSRLISHNVLLETFRNDHQRF